MTRYSFAYTEDGLKPLKIIVLAAALLVDFVNFWSFLAAAIFGDWKGVLTCVCIFAGLTLCRVAIQFVSYTLEYEVQNGKFTICKTYPICKINKLDCNIGEIKAVRTIERRFDSRGKFDNRTLLKSFEGATLLCPRACREELFMIELFDGRKLLTPLDDYAVFLLTQFTGKSKEGVSD